jgi:Zn-dependent peptidase ImmA (M78 family)
MISLHISPKILRWAADQRGLSLDALADLLGPPSKHEDFLAGNLSIAQTETLAKKTHIPFGYFFLDHPPEIAARTIPDLRQTANPEPLSIDFNEVFDDILRKQQWYLEYLQDQNVSKLDFVGKFSFNAGLPVEEIAEDIKQILGLTDYERQQCQDYSKFYALLSEKAESIGILVFKNGVVKSSSRRGLSVKEFRGFAIADSYAPVIFINGKDSKTAWIFTLAHELAHIWLGESGVSDLPDKRQVGYNNLEAYCNRIAAEFLTPKQQFLAAWEHAVAPQFEALSKIFKVSKLVIARRALDLGKIDRATYQTVAASSNQQISSGDGDAYLNVPIRNSKKLTHAIVTAAMSNGMLLREAASLLNVKTETVMELSKRLGIR